MALYLLQSSASLIILYGLYYTCLKDLTFFKYNRFFLLLSLVISLIAPISATFFEFDSNMIPTFQMTLESFTIYASKVNDRPIIITSNWWLYGIWVVYCVGVAFVLAKMLFGMLKILQLKMHGTKEIKSGVEVVTTESIHLPFSFFKTVYVSKHLPLPNKMATIIDHEKIHMKQWHSLDIIFVEVLRALLWFNPILIFYKKSIQQSHEYFVDAEICKRESIKNYTELLLSSTQIGLQMTLTNQFFHSQIKKRIKMMTQNQSSRKFIWNYGLIIPALFAIIFVFACQGQTPNAIAKTENLTAEEVAEALTVVEQMPTFPGCDHIGLESEKYECARHKMLEYIYQNLKYPEQARTNGVEGTVVVQFVIDLDGKLKNITVVRPLGAGCEDEVVKTLTSMNENNIKWNPGRQNGKAVRVLYTLPIKFKLEGE